MGDICRGSWLSGDDAIVTKDLDDIIYGGLGDDFIDAGEGNDEIRPGGGFNIIKSGIGNDSIYFEYTDDNKENQTCNIIRDYVAGEDNYVFNDYPSLILDEVIFEEVEAGVAINLGNNRYFIFEGISEQSELNGSDFTFIGGPPVFENVSLVVDSGESSEDGITNVVNISGKVSDTSGITHLEIKQGDQEQYGDISEVLSSNGEFVISREIIETATNQALNDGFSIFTLRATDKGGIHTETTVQLDLDTKKPELLDFPGANSNGIVTQGGSTLTLQFDAQIQIAALNKFENFTLSSNLDNTPEITSCDYSENSNTLYLDLSKTLDDGSYELGVENISDVAGNILDARNIEFEVNSATRIISVSPGNGESQNNLNRKIVIEFDRPVQEEDINTENISLKVSDQNLDGRLHQAGGCGDW